MKQRVITALMILLVTVPALYVGGIPLKILVFALSALAAYELISLRNGPKNYGLAAFIFLSIIVFYNVPHRFYIAALGFYAIVLFLLTIIFEDIKVTDICYIFIVSIIITLAVKGILNIYNYGFAMMLYVGVACYGCDSGAYFFGYFFGKHKMIPRISPNKTWEGAFGGWLTGMVLSLLVGFLLIKNININIGFILLNSFMLPIIAQIGDLSFSAIKRHYGVKDFGSIFPGHGGVLDRLDSLLFCLMFINSVLVIMVR